MQSLLYLEHDRIRTFNSGRLEECSSNDLKRLRSGTIIPLSLLNTHTLKLSDHLTSDELQIQVEIRMYEEGNLQSEDEYVIAFIKHHIALESSFLIEVFALSYTKAADYFHETLQRVSLIDLIVPGFLVYESLYPELGTKNDLFVYWGAEEAYGAIYQGGDYIAHRAIDTLTTIAVETGYELQKLRFILSERGVIETNYPPEEFGKFNLIQERLAKNIERIVHAINHKRGLFGLQGIDRVYLDMDGMSIPGLETLFAAYGMEQLEILPLTEEGVPPSQTHDTLCARYLQTHLDEPRFNLSPYMRRPSWYKRESGKFLAIFGVSLLIALMTPITLSWMTSQEEERLELLNAELARRQQEVAPLAQELKAKNTLLAEHKHRSEELKNEIALIQGADETADLISEMHIRRQQFLVDTTSEMGRYRLGSLMIEQNGSKEMQLHVIADDKKRDDIAKMMSGLYERGYQDVQTHEIALDNGFYNSIVKVIR